MDLAEDVTAKIAAAQAALDAVSPALQRATADLQQAVSGFDQAIVDLDDDTLAQVAQSSGVAALAERALRLADALNSAVSIGERCW